MTRVVSIPAVVVLPAPLGPSRPNISPPLTLRLSLSTAAKSVPAYTLVNSTVRMTSPAWPSLRTSAAVEAKGGFSTGCVSAIVPNIQRSRYAPRSDG